MKTLVLVEHDGAIVKDPTLPAVTAASQIGEVHLLVIGSNVGAVAEAAEAFQSGRIFIAGDAAHTMPPTGGFGGNTGIQDAHNIAWKLALVLRGTAGERSAMRWRSKRAR